VTMLSLTVNKLLTMVRIDEDRQVVMTILDSTNEMLADIKKPVLDAVESPDVFISLIKDVFQQKVDAAFMRSVGSYECFRRLFLSCDMTQNTSVIYPLHLKYLDPTAFLNIPTVLVQYQ